MSATDISVIISTYNRCESLAGALRTLVTQNPGKLRFEAIIVDNNSTDNTRSIVKAYQGGDVEVRYVFEGKQGLSYGRNAGVANARSPICAFSDDDIRFPSDWVIKVKEGFDRYPEVMYVGGRVLPQWQSPPPRWALPKLAPFGLQDHGEIPMFVDRAFDICLVGANLACRRELFGAVGLFDPATQRVKNGIGSMEDHEWQKRIWKAGFKGIYFPELVVYAPIGQERLTKRYHRRWHFGHGRFLAILGEPSFEAASWHLGGVPAHVYRKALGHFSRGLRFQFQRAHQESFRQECFGLHNLGFIAQRWKANLNRAFIGRGKSSHTDRFTSACTAQDSIASTREAGELREFQS